MPQRVAELCAAWPSLVQGLPVTVSAACEGFSAAALLAVLAGPVAQLQPRHLTVAALDTCSGQWDPTGVLQVRGSTALWGGGVRILLMASMDVRVTLLA